MDTLASLVARLESVTGRLERCGGSASPTSAGVEQAESPFAPLLDRVSAWAALPSASALVQQQQQAFVNAFQTQAHFLATAAVAKKPADAARMGKLIQPTSTALQVVSELKEKNRPAKEYNVLATIAEGAPALGWVCVEPKPVPFILEMKDAAQFYANRVVKDSPEYKDIVNGFTAILIELSEIVKQNHVTGLKWNANGKDALVVFAATSQSKPVTAGSGSAAAAPPPPPLVSGDGVSAPSASTGSKPDVSALLNQLNSGSSVTSGLKKVDKNQMTHKNPELRKTGAITEVSRVDSSKSNKVVETNKPSKIALEGNKWVIEYASGNVKLGEQGHEIDMKQTVYCYRCKDMTLEIPGKINSLTIDACTKSGVVANSLLASADVINSSRIQLQILAQCPTIAVDKSDGVQIFALKETAEQLDILTARSGEVNLMVGEQEFSIGEQIKSNWKAGKIESVVVEHKG